MDQTGNAEKKGFERDFKVIATRFGERFEKEVKGKSIKMSPEFWLD